MKLKAYVSMSLVCLLLVSGCSKSITDSNVESTFTKAMSEGKLALASKEYDKAEGLFSLAVEENKDDKEANVLYEQTSKLLTAIELIEDGELEEAKSALEEVKNIDNKLASVEKEVDKLLEDINLGSETKLEYEVKTDVKENKTQIEAKGNLVLDYVVNQSEDDMNGIVHRDGSGKIVLAESDYTDYESDEDGERLVSTYVPESSVRFSLKNIGDETIKNPVINFNFNDMAIEFEPSEKWQGIGHNRGIGTWYEVRWSPQPGTTIQPGIPVDFTFGFQNASVYSDNASIDITLSGDNFKAKKFNIPVKLRKMF